MKHFVIILFFTVICLETYGREIIEEIIEPAILEIRYERRTVLDTLDMENVFSKDFLTLKIGKTVSAFYSAERKTSDSIEERHPKSRLRYSDNPDAWKARSRLPKEKIFKNYPTGKLRVHDRFDLTNWLSDENLEKPEWTVSDSVSNIMGYECIFAETDFRGRHWEVWFTPEIPISDGPWKLWGLPGLILSARDSKGHYTYHPVAIGSERIGNVEYFDYGAGARLKTTREKALPNKWRYIHENIRDKIAAMGMIQFKNPSSSGKKLYIHHDNYDFEEMDYPHQR